MGSSSAALQVCLDRGMTFALWWTWACCFPFSMFALPKCQLCPANHRHGLQRGEAQFTCSTPRREGLRDLLRVCFLKGLLGFTVQLVLGIEALRVSRWCTLPAQRGGLAACSHTPTHTLSGPAPCLALPVASSAPGLPGAALEVWTREHPGSELLSGKVQSRWHEAPLRENLLRLIPDVAGGLGLTQVSSALVSSV